MMNIRSRLTKKRGVSPVIATILIITVSLAAAVSISTILSNIDDNNSIDTNATLGSSSSSNSLSVESEITKLSGDILLQIQNISDYTRLTIKLTYDGDKPNIYVIDFDILVYGIKLDDQSPWSIVDADGATYTTVNGQYGGYKQAKGTSVQYVVEVEDITNTRARVPDKTTFSYEVKIGEEPGTIKTKILNEREAKVIFNFISYNVSIFHWGSNFAKDNAAKQLESTLISENGTNNLFFNYDRAVDAFDISDPAIVANMNATAISEKYKVIMVDKWLVPKGAGDLLTDVHSNGTSLIFYGSIEEFDPNNEDFNVVISNIDYPATKNITGLIPNVYEGPKPKGSVNGYQFYSALDGVLAGLDGEQFWEIPEKKDKLKGDRRGFDAANFTDEVDKFDVLGNATYQFYSEDKAKKVIPKNLIWSHNGPVLIRKNGITGGSGDVYSFVWKNHENINDKKATKVETTHLSSIRKNMLLSVVNEMERQAFNYAELTIDSLTLLFKDNKNKKFDFEIQATVTNADINAGTLVFTVDMPFNFDWKKTDYKYNFYIDGNRKLKKQAITVDTSGANDVLVFDIGSSYAGGIPKDSVILITISEKFGDKKWLELNKSNTNFGDWNITAKFESGTFALADEATYTINTAVDSNEW